MVGGWGLDGAGRTISSMASLSPYLPPHLRTSLAKRKSLPAEGRTRRFPAALLLADISGFTSLTEKLQRKGRVGAEETARIVNRAFRPAIRAIESQGGSIVCFGGDALFVVFPGRAGVARAAAAAEGVRAAVDAASTPRIRVGVSQGIHYGNVVELHLGAGKRRHYLVGGSTVDAVVRREGRAGSGEILLSRQARARLARGKNPRARPKPATEPDDRVAAYLDPGLPMALRGFKGQYRRTTILFLETRGFSPRHLQPFFETLCRILQRYDGMLVKTDVAEGGTRWLCTFGLPTAHERDPDRAARAALDLLAARPRGLSLRGGLHAGTLVNIIVGTRTRRSFDVMGDVVNTAARALAKGDWGEILATEHLRRNMSGVETARRGRYRVKGKTEALTLHALTGAGPAVRQIRLSAPMIGRDPELSTLVEALAQARIGKGSAISISGQAGIGKSRLKYEAIRKGVDLGFRVHEGRASSFAEAPYGAARQVVRDALELPARASANEVLARVDRTAGHLPKVVDRHHLAELLGAPFPDSPLRHLSPQHVRLNNMIAIQAFFLALATEAPRILVFEDAHWADEASIEAMEWLAKGARQSAMVVLLLHRPGFEPPPEAVRIPLEELPEDAVAELLGAYLGEVPPPLLSLLRERAGANPFYLEELLRHFMETGVLEKADGGHRLRQTPSSLELPDSIEALIAARLDELSPDARRVAQHAAVIGRRSSCELLNRLPALAGKARAGLEELVDRELMQQGDDDAHVFKHALTCDVSYATLLSPQRRQIHRQVAATLEETRDDPASQALLGHHWEQAGRPVKARRAYLAAARESVRTHSLDEAEALYRGYLRLTSKPSEESITARNELATRVLEVRGEIDKALALFRLSLSNARQAGLRRHEGHSLRLFGRCLQGTARWSQAQEALAQALKICREVGDRWSEGATLGVWAIILRDRGEPSHARRLFEKALAISRECGDRGAEGIWLGSLGDLSHREGDYETAAPLYREAIAVAEEAHDLKSKGVNLTNLANLHQAQGQLAEARACFESSLAIHRRTGNRKLEGHVLGNLGNMLTDHGHAREAQERYEAALTISREVADRSSEGIHLGNLSLLFMARGDWQTSRSLQREGLAIAQELGDRPSEAIRLGNLGTIHQRTGQLDEALRLFEQALDIAQAVGIKRFEGYVLKALALTHHLLGAFERARDLYGRALEVHQSLRDVRFQGSCLVGMAQNSAFLADGTSAEVQAVEGISLLEDVDDQPGLVSGHCILGHVRLSRGCSGAGPLARAKSLHETLAASGVTEAREDLGRLERAQRNFREARPLVVGFCPEDLTPAQWDWLRKHRPHALPASLGEPLEDEPEIGE